MNEFVPYYGQESNYGLGDGIGVIAGPDYVEPVAGPALTNYVPDDIGLSTMSLPTYDVPAYDVGTYDIGLPSQPVDQPWYKDVGNFAFNTVPGYIGDLLSPQQDSLESILGGLTKPGEGASQSEIEDYRFIRNQAVLDYRSDKNKASINPGTWGFQEWSTLGIAGLGLYEYLEGKSDRKKLAEDNTPERKAEDRIAYLQALRDAGFNSSGQALTDVEASQESSGGGAVVTGNHSTNPFLT